MSKSVPYTEKQKKKILQPGGSTAHKTGQQGYPRSHLRKISDTAYCEVNYTNQTYQVEFENSTKKITRTFRRKSQSNFINFFLKFLNNFEILSNVELSLGFLVLNKLKSGKN